MLSLIKSEDGNYRKDFHFFCFSDVPAKLHLALLVNINFKEYSKPYLFYYV